MAFPIALVPMALSAIRGLVRYRDQLDRIFIAKEASADLPFLLPPAPDSVSGSISAMRTFFQTDEGRSILEFSGQTEVFANLAVSTDDQRKELVRLHLEVQGLQLEKVGPSIRVREDLSQDAQLAYFMVSSHRLSRNPTVTRVILATADALLEFAGENASFFVSNPKTAGIVGTVVREFAGKEELNDLSARLIVRRLIGSAVVAAIDHRGELPDNPALNLLYSALSVVQKKHGEMGADFVNEIVTKDGFQLVVQTYLTMGAKDPQFLGMLATLVSDRDADDPFSNLAKETFGAVLNELGTNLTDILDDPKGLAGVMEAALGAAAKNAGPLLEKKFNGEPLILAVLKGVADDISSKADADELFRSVATGEAWSSLFTATLSAVAANPQAIQSTADISGVASKLVAAVAGTLADQGIKDLVNDGGKDAFRQLVSQSLIILAEDPEFLEGQSDFAAKLLRGILESAAPLLRDGLQVDDILVVVDRAIVIASPNLALTALDDRLVAILGSMGSALATDGVKGLLSAKGRRDALLAGLQAVAANPTVWNNWASDQQRDILQPLLVGLLDGLTSDPTKLLSSVVLVDTFRRCLTVLGRKGAKWVKGQGVDVQLKNFIDKALARADQEIGKSLDGEILPDYLERVLIGFLADPFDTAAANADAKVKKITDNVIGQLETMSGG